MAEFEVVKIDPSDNHALKLDIAKEYESIDVEVSTETHFLRLWFEKKFVDNPLNFLGDPEFDPTKLHRTDGPALEICCKKTGKLGGKFGLHEYFLYGKFIEPKDVDIWLEENNIDLQTDEGQMAFILRWS